MPKKTLKPKPVVNQPTKDLRSTRESKVFFAKKATAKKAPAAKRVSSAKKAAL